MWDPVKGFREVQKDYVSLATYVSFTCKAFYCEDQLCFTGMPLVETMLSIIDDVIVV